MPTGVEVVQGEALEVMKGLADGVAHCVITDPPYGTTACEWDDATALHEWLDEMVRVTREDGAVVITACGTFTRDVLVARPKLFRYKWVWDRAMEDAAGAVTGKPTGFLDANRRPLRRHEDVLVLGRKMPWYQPVYSRGKPYVSHRESSTELYRNFGAVTTVSDGRRFPVDVLRFPPPTSTDRVHPTQKPVELMDMLVRSYCPEGGLVIDPFCGSGTTMLACVRTGRRGLGVERDAKYAAIAKSRVAESGGLFRQEIQSPSEREDSCLWPHSNV